MLLNVQHLTCLCHIAIRNHYYNEYTLPAETTYQREHVMRNIVLHHVEPRTQTKTFTDDMQENKTKYK